jgi:hypothetical protein
VSSKAVVSNLKEGDRVRHTAAPQWGLGQLLDNPVGGKANILFADEGKKLIFLLPELVLVQGEEAEDAALDRMIERRRSRPSGDTRKIKTGPAGTTGVQLSLNLRSSS